MALSSGWATLGDYEKLRASFAADDQLQSVIRTAGDLFTNATDSITQVIKPPGDRGTYAGINMAMMHMPAVAEAVPFALEVAEFVDKKLGNSIGVMNAMTGNRAGIAWMGFSDSLDELAKDGQALESDPEYVAFFGRSADLFVPGTLEYSIWQLLP